MQVLTRCQEIWKEQSHETPHFFCNSSPVKWILIGMAITGCVLALIGLLVCSHVLQVGILSRGLLPASHGAYFFFGGVAVGLAVITALFTERAVIRSLHPPPKTTS